LQQTVSLDANVGRMDTAIRNPAFPREDVETPDSPRRVVLEENTVPLCAMEFVERGVCPQGLPEAVSGEYQAPFVPVSCPGARVHELHDLRVGDPGGTRLTRRHQPSREPTAQIQTVEADVERQAQSVAPTLVQLHDPRQFEHCLIVVLVERRNQLKGSRGVTFLQSETSFYGPRAGWLCSQPPISDLAIRLLLEALEPDIGLPAFYTALARAVLHQCQPVEQRLVGQVLSLAAVDEVVCEAGGILVVADDLQDLQGREPVFRVQCLATSCRVSPCQMCCQLEASSIEKRSEPEIFRCSGPPELLSRDELLGLCGREPGGAQALEFLPGQNHRLAVQLRKFQLGARFRA